MTTSIEIPNPLYRRAKARATELGQSVTDFVTEAIKEKLAKPVKAQIRTQPEWMRGFGQLRHLRRETAKIQARINRDEL